MGIMVGIGTALAAEITAFAAAYTNVILIPGPSFVVVCEAAFSGTRRDARLVAVGVACGAAALSIMILLAAPMLQTSPGLVIAGRFGCALILLGMGVRVLSRSIRGVRAADGHRSGSSVRAYFATGFVAAATNPISFASFTTAALTFGRTGHGTDCGVIALVVFAMAVGWFNTLALVVSQPLLTTHYGRAARTLGSVMGCVLMVKALSVLVPAL